MAEEIKFTLEWDQDGQKFYETGVDRGVVYPKTKKVTGTDGKETIGYDKGAAWNGLVNVTESPEGAEATPLYANNNKYLEIMSNEDFKGSIEAYMYPDEFGVCLGQVELDSIKGVYATQQERKLFGLTYRTLIGNDTEGTNYGYKLHIVYNALAGVSEKTNQTTGEENEPETMSWDFSTTPVPYKEMKPTAHIVIDSTKFATTELKAKLTALEEILYGTESKEPTLPDIETIVKTLGTAAAE